MFSHRTVVRLHDTDAAGILFFAHQFKIAHDAYESFMEGSGNSFASIFRDQTMLIPIVHAEADYEAALEVGDYLSVRMVAEQIGDSSFALSYKLVDNDDRVVGTVKTVHVCINRQSGEKISVPDKLRRALEAIA